MVIAGCSGVCVRVCTCQAQEVAIGPQPAELGPKQLDQLPVALDLTLLELARPGGC